MGKKVDVKEYQCELIKVVDGDTIDCFIDLGFNLKTKKRVRYMGIDTWESRTRDLEEKKKGLAAKARNKELLEEGVFKLKSFGTGKFGRVLGEIFVDPDIVGEHINECIANDDSDIVFGSLTECLNQVFKVHEATQFFVDAKKGEVYIEDGVEKPQPVKKYSLYGEEI